MAFTAQFESVRKETNSLEVRVKYSNNDDSFSRDYQLNGSETKAEVLAMIRTELRRLNKIAPLEAIIKTEITANTVIGE